MSSVESQPFDLRCLDVLDLSLSIKANWMKFLGAIEQPLMSRMCRGAALLTK